MRAAIRAERYFDGNQMPNPHPLRLADASPGAGDSELLALEAFIKTVRIDDSATMVSACIAREGELPGLMLRIASPLGMQADFRGARDILVGLNRALPKCPAILRRLVLVHVKLREQEQAEAFSRVLEKVEAA